MGTEAQIRGAIDLAIDEVNAALPPARQLGKSPDTRLFGQGGALDSLGLINLIVAAERHLEAALRYPLTLADERAMSQKNSPFRTVESLIAYVGQIAGKAARA